MMRLWRRIWKSGWREIGNSEARKPGSEEKESGTQEIRKRFGKEGARGYGAEELGAKKPAPKRERRLREDRGDP